jgi:uncharacterized protein YndB with AHSA1/START domain
MDLAPKNLVRERKRMIITQTVASSGRELTITRTLDATPHDAFNAWLDPVRAKAWMAPRGFQVSNFESDARPGGSWRLCLRDEKGNELWQSGVYREIAADQRLVFSFVREERGVRGHETTVTVNFVPKAEKKTTITLEQGTFESMSDRDGHRAAWNTTFDRLADHVRNH